MKNVFTPLAKTVSVSLGLMTAASGTDVAIQKNIYFQSGAPLIIYDEEMDDMKIVKSVEDSGLAPRLTQPFILPRLIK